MPDADRATGSAGTYQASRAAGGGSNGRLEGGTGGATNRGGSGGSFITSLGSGTVGSDGPARITLTALGAGAHNLTATYEGDANSQGSTSDWLSETVNSASAPVARAGPDLTVTTGATKTLDGSGSSDPQAEPLTYAWEQIEGPPVTIGDHHAAKTTVTAQTATGPAHLRLTVTNAAGLSNSDDILITVKAPK